ncbi:membrane protein [Rhodopirellula maiorica SM1]|uniref:Membrane protein n=1 Tax=Rhodopirellula maiorica SM1 TaxID=1265738 RepID=M5RQR8_9BACT|nr:hypothetical protein [Rhodopirellula maiorica]EMI21566.1 membrane protein [Rhodopirellula maiorica SM1]
MTVNPYQPPREAVESSDDGRNSAQSLKRAATLYRWLGCIGITYFCVVYPIGLWSDIHDTPFRLGATIGMTLMAALFVGLFVMMVRIASRLQTDLLAVYGRARWAGLLVGAFGFPFLTIPAFYAVWLVGRGRAEIETTETK